MPEDTWPTGPTIEERSGDVWFVYDGDCPICSLAANALAIRQSVGALHLVDARQDRDHPLLAEIRSLGMNLDDGMVLKYGKRCYHGKDALTMMAILGSGRGWFNRMNALLFRSSTMARLCYPVMRAGRNMLLHLKGIEKIRNLEGTGDRPMFQSVFGPDWDRLPPVMRRHYAVRPYSADRVRVAGHLTVRIAPWVRVLARLTGMLVSREGQDVSVSVTFTSGPQSRAFHFDRLFRFPDADERFRSRMEHQHDNELIEFMRFGMGWRLTYHWEDGRVVLRHKGYVWRIFGLTLPVPLTLILGRGHAEEVPLSGGTFRMWTYAEHPWFGRTFGYEGMFRIEEVTCDPS